MPCWKCGAREVDPVRGPSPWKRGVRGGEHVLVCPACQSIHDWSNDLDHCPSCGSWRLSRALGQITCRDCGSAISQNLESDADGPAPSEEPTSSGLADEVTRALARMWGKAPDR